MTMLELLTRPLPPRKHAPRAINLVPRPSLKLVWSAPSIISETTIKPAPLEVDGVTIVYCRLMPRLRRASAR